MDFTYFCVTQVMCRQIPQARCMMMVFHFPGELETRFIEAPMRVQSLKRTSGLWRPSLSHRQQAAPLHTFTTSGPHRPAPMPSEAAWFHIGCRRRIGARPSCTFPCRCTGKKHG